LFLVLPTGCLPSIQHVALPQAEAIAHRVLLTYMSIRIEIKRRIAEGRLFRLRPHVGSDPNERIVLMSSEIHNLVSGPWPDGPMGVRCGYLRADLESFVANDVMTVSWSSFEARDAKMGRLHPLADEVWDLRSQAPPPGLRVFCRFAEKDVLVALTCSPRSVPVPWLDRIPLLRRNSRAWRDPVVGCRREWDVLFPAHQPLVGVNLNDYISNAVLQ
jgi:hypothetical protein